MEMREWHRHPFPTCTTHGEQPGYMDPECKPFGQFDYCYPYHDADGRHPYDKCVHKLLSDSGLHAALNKEGARRAVELVSQIAHELGYEVSLEFGKHLTQDELERLAQVSGLREG